MADLRAMIEAVRAADKAWEQVYDRVNENVFLGLHPATAETFETREKTLWRAKQDARRALREAVYAETGVNVDELKSLTQG